MEPKQIGKYHIVEKIGQGAMGDIFRAHDPALHRYVAIKTISQGLDSDPLHRQRFLREARSAAGLIHPNIVTIFDFGEDGGRAFMAMELLEGMDLKDLIRKETPLDLSRKLNLMDQICGGVGYAHSKGIIHRDLKPGNIHVQPNGQVKIMDFGLARLDSSDMTKTGVVMGTPNYMSPEQVQALPVDSRSDVFSLGAVFYELLTNHKPFDADSIHAILFKVVQGEGEPIGKWAPHLPKPLVRVIDKALSKDRDQRYRDAQELLEALREVRKRMGPALEADDIWSSELQETLLNEPPSVRQQTSQAPEKSSPASQPYPSTPGKGTLRQWELTNQQPHQRLLYPGMAIGLLALAGVAFFLFKWHSSRDGVEAPSGTAVVSEPLGQSQIELARQSLESKDYGQAIAVSEAILETEPEQAEALAILEEARRMATQLESALREAQSLLDSGQPTQAARALAVVLAIDPNHPSATELSGRLNHLFREQAAETHSGMDVSRQAALAAGAGSLGAFLQASQLRDEGEKQFDRQEYAVATQKFISAKNLFDRARQEREKEADQRRRSEARGRTEFQQVANEWKQLRSEVSDEEFARQPAFSSARSLEHEAERLSDKGSYVEATNAYRRATENLLQAKEEALKIKAREDSQTTAVAVTEQSPAPTLPAAPQFPPTPEPSPPEPSPPATSSVPVIEVETSAIRDVILTWKQAIENKDLALYRSIKPNLSAQDEGRLQASFEAIDTHQVVLTILSIDVQGSRAKVRLARNDTIVADRQTHSATVEQTLAMSKESGKWVVIDIRD